MILLDFDDSHSDPDTESALIRSDPMYKPYCILRFTGEANLSETWQSKLLAFEEEEEDDSGC
jgi:hypothetical protein